MGTQMCQDYEIYSEKTFSLHWMIELIQWRPVGENLLKIWDKQGGFLCGGGGGVLKWNTPDY